MTGDCAKGDVDETHSGSEQNAVDWLISPNDVPRE